MRKKVIGIAKDGSGLAVGLRYDGQRQELLIGGPQSTKDILQDVAEFFGENVCIDGRWCGYTNGHRPRWLFTKVNQDSWEEGLRQMDEDWSLHPVRTFRRLMG